MKTIIIFLFLCVTVNAQFFKLGFYFSNSGVRYGEELLANNRSFETYTGTQDDGTTDTFSGWANSVGAAGVIESVSDARTGTSALKISRVTSSSSIRQVVNVTAEGEYVYQFYTKGDGTNPGAFAVFDLTHTTFITSTTPCDVTQNEYTLVQHTFTAPAGCSQVIVYLFNPIANNCYAIFDDVSVKEIL